jgi:PKD repeat protein
LNIDVLTFINTLNLTYMKTRNLIIGLFSCIGTMFYYGIDAQDYESALRAGINFFDANRCGKDVATDNVFNWRGACHVDDGDVAGLDLTGGFHDAGDHVKFGLPQTWTAATLGFALYEFRESFDQAGATSKMLSTLKIFTDFFIKCHVSSNTFYYNIGDGHADHGYWGSPEAQTGSRPVTVATPSSPASDVCGEAAAALALMYLNYQNVNSTYANECLSHAEQLFNLGRNYLGRSNDGGGGSFYKSSSHFDDLTWGAIWLYIATGEESYLADVESWIETPNDYGDDPYDKHWAPAWDDVTVFAMLKLYEITGEQKYYDGVINNLEWYRDDCTKTPYGLPWLDSWGVLRYASAEAGVGYLAAKKFEYAGYMETADLTMNYTVGVNPRNSSYISNWGNNPPQHPHHRANEPNRDGSTNGLVGALVGGPNSSDGYSDNVNDYVMNEVAIDYNASFVLGMAGKIYFEYNTPPQPNEPPIVSVTSPSSGASYDQGETITINANATDNDGSVELVEFMVSGTKIAEDASAPYSTTWTIPLAGNYTITARAIDNKNGSTTSSEVNITAVSNIPDPTTPNLALNKTASASSLENDGLPASNGVDGSYGSRWSSAFEDPQWFQVDMGALYVINRTILFWEAAAGKVYDIQVSTDGESWTTVAVITGGNGGEDDIVFSDISARYVRMYGTERTTPYGYSLYEFEIYGAQQGENISPVAAITANPMSGESPLVVTFNGENSYDSDGSIVSYSWDFGDGTTGNGSEVAHTYSLADSYSAILTVTDNEDATGQASVTIVVTDPNQCLENQVPSISLQASPLSGDAPLLVSFDASGTTDPDDDELSFSWDFKDGNIGSGSAIQHTFTQAGTYIVGLTVTDVCGKSSQASVTITVNQGSGEICDSPVNVNLPYSYDGSGEYCWFISEDVANINSWSLELLEINGADYTNVWSDALPAKVNGGYYVRYIGSYGWSHFEAASLKSTSGISAENTIGVFPNPFSSISSIEIDKPELVKQIEIYDQLGRIIMMIDKSEVKSKVFFGENLKSGVYIIKIKTDKEIKTFRASKY